MATAGWRGIFPGSPDEWSLIAVGEGFASAAQCTTDSSWQPYEGGLRQPGHSHCREKHKCCWIALLLENVFTNDHLPPIEECGGCVQTKREMVNFLLCPVIDLALLGLSGPLKAYSLRLDQLSN